MHETGSDPLCASASDVGDDGFEKRRGLVGSVGQLWLVSGDGVIEQALQVFSVLEIGQALETADA